MLRAPVSLRWPAAGNGASLKWKLRLTESQAMQLHGGERGVPDTYLRHKHHKDVDSATAPYTALLKGDPARLGPVLAVHVRSASRPCWVS